MGGLMPARPFYLWTGCGNVCEQLTTNLGKTSSKVNPEAGGGVVILVAHIYNLRRLRKEGYKFKASVDHSVSLRPTQAMYETCLKRAGDLVRW